MLRCRRAQRTRLLTLCFFRGLKLCKKRVCPKDIALSPSPLPFSWRRVPEAGRGIAGCDCYRHKSCMNKKRGNLIKVNSLATHPTFSLYIFSCYLIPILIHVPCSLFPIPCSLFLINFIITKSNKNTLNYLSNQQIKLQINQ